LFVPVRLLGSVYYTKGDITEAQRYLSRASELIPNDPTPILYLGMLSERQGAIQQAADRYEQVIAMAPDNVVALNNLAYILAETTGDLDRALTLIQKARGLAPADPNIADTLGYVYVKKKLPGSALPILEDVVRQNPDIVIWRYHLALALYQDGRAEQARQQLQTALGKGPSDEEKFKIDELLSQIGS
jgi:tetratricopeptide (TPR) repeat protein